ncbi:hypothetical protein SeMB42_g02675 [Synchytrium endobioticum]|uniref:2,5-diamino-6-ribosylamino-4(3H)-pyrimidinone 5'-phosphate reductase n=1 Tax=Synchytrium endobioticum TaxID=286115 RepID=A0A507D9J9_9FUNG|nr:hypothetical protein SeLEV6574_g02113 [Synchytrium endobioticum]TPX49283.1 hypothetical protein SeMB42_g02675 [Synchytrium endobioticum]
MSHIETLEQEAYDFLLPLFSIKDSNSPAVTLTYASSLDALISGRNGQQLLLSGRESMVMTHALRAIHDGILVGIGTVLNDNPSLTVRHVSHLPDGKPVEKHPRPIILDAKLRIPVNSNVMNRWPIIITSNGGEADDVQTSTFHVLYKDYSMASIMIEGGASVIRRQGVHATGVGSGNTTWETALKMPELHQVVYKQFGRDMVIAARILERLPGD